MQNTRLFLTKSSSQPYLNYSRFWRFCLENLSFNSYRITCIFGKCQCQFKNINNVKSGNYEHFNKMDTIKNKIGKVNENMVWISHYINKRWKKWQFFKLYENFYAGLWDICDDIWNHFFSLITSVKLKILWNLQKKINLKYWDLEKIGKMIEKNMLWSIYSMNWVF